MIDPRQFRQLCRLLVQDGQMTRAAASGIMELVEVYTIPAEEVKMLKLTRVLYEEVTTEGDDDTDIQDARLIISLVDRLVGPAAS